MRFHLGAIPDSLDWAPDDRWKPLREPAPWMMQLLAFPVGVASAATVGLLWSVFTPLLATTPTVTPALLLSLIGTVLVHELLHACVHPMSGRSRQSILGFWPSRALLYAHYDGELTRNRFVAILLTPFLVISITPLLIAAATPVTFHSMAIVSTFNALVACGDLLGAGLVLFQVPASAIVRNQGWRTHWRAHETAAADVTATARIR